jgi:alpha-beta hydrolase superfamily lysophospholipase
MPSGECTTSSLVTRSGTAEPLYFRSGQRDLFGWLHRPAKPPRSKLGVVICSPYGYESICAHRSIRAFAEAISDIGIQSLRFDYGSTGDSSEIDENADHVSLWTQDVLAAIRELRARTGVERVCLLGIRLGTLLASLAAAESAGIESLILVGPVVSGRRFVRELRTAQLAGLAFSGSPPPELAGGRQAQNLEAGGFSFSAATIESLARVDLLTLPAPAVRSILVLDNDTLPSAKRWVESFSASGVAVEYRTLPGLIEMAMTAPQFAATPQEMIEAARQWLSRLANSAVNIAAAEAPLPYPPYAEPSPGSTTAIVLAGEQESSGGAITEYPAWIPAGDTSLFGIVTEPLSGERRRRAVILLNAGADFHIGASRMYVSLARRWARRGYSVLRLDFAGIGDSPTRPGTADDEVFPEEALLDIRSAVEYMRARYKVSDMTLAGLCSGAYHALRAAAAGLDINRILMVNPQNYFWEKGMSLDRVQLAEVAHNPGLYRRRVFSWIAWKRLFNGQVNIGRIAIIYLQRLRLGATSYLTSVARLLHIKLRHDLAWELEKIAASGIRVTFVFARGEPGLKLLRLQAGSAVTRLRDKCRVRVVDSGDHIFSRREHRDIMENVLSEELFARADDQTEPGEPGARRPMMLAK